MLPIGIIQPPRDDGLSHIAPQAALKRYGSRNSLGSNSGSPGHYHSPPVADRTNHWAEAHTRGIKIDDNIGGTILARLQQVVSSQHRIEAKIGRIFKDEPGLSPSCAQEAWQSATGSRTSVQYPPGRRSYTVGSRDVSHDFLQWQALPPKSDLLQTQTRSVKSSRSNASQASRAASSTARRVGTMQSGGTRSFGSGRLSDISDVSSSVEAEPAANGLRSTAASGVGTLATADVGAVDHEMLRMISENSCSLGEQEERTVTTAYVSEGKCESIDEHKMLPYSSAVTSFELAAQASDQLQRFRLGPHLRLASPKQVMLPPDEGEAADDDNQNQIDSLPDSLIAKRQGEWQAKSFSGGSSGTIWFSPTTNRCSLGSLDEEEGGFQPALTLPPDWPGMLQLRPELHEHTHRKSSVRFEPMQTGHLGDIFAEAGVVRHARFFLMMHPMSKRRLMLDLVGLVVLCYDLFLTPYILAWDLDLNVWMQGCAATAAAFWAFDVLASFRTGFYRNGLLEMRPASVAKAYLRSWFFLDVSIIGCELFSLVAQAAPEGKVSDEATDSTINAAGIARFSKLTRLLRIAGIFRLLRISNISTRLADRGMTRQWDMVCEISKLLLSILWLNHVISCTWFAIGRSPGGDTGGHWVDLPIAPGSKDDLRTIAGSSEAYQYFTSLHWSLAQMSPGSMEVQPRNTGERIFNVLCLMFGLFFFTSMISSLSTKMVHFKMLNQEQTSMFASLRRFLRQEAISKELAVSVQKQAQKRMETKRLLISEDVPAISLLSLSLQMEIHFESCRPHLRAHPFMRFWANSDRATFKKMCFQSISFSILAQDDTLFLPGTEAQQAYFLCEGLLEYTPEPHHEPEVYLGIHNDRSSQQTILTKAGTECDPEPVGPGSWLCEGALWSEWIHVGTAVATSDAKLLIIDAHKFVRELVGHRLTRSVAVEYSKAYHRILTSSVPPRVSWPSDLCVPHATYDEVMASIEPGVRSFMSLIVFNTISAFTPWHKDARKGRRNTQRLNQLRSEVLDGTTTLVFDPSGEVRKVVWTCSIELGLETTSKMLMQVAKGDEDGFLQFAPALPGTSPLPGECPLDVIDRMLSGLLAPFASGLKLGRMYVESTVKQTARNMIPTHCLQTIQELSLDGFLPPHSFLPSVVPDASKPVRPTALSDGSSIAAGGNISTFRALPPWLPQMSMMSMKSDARKPSFIAKTDSEMREVIAVIRRLYMFALHDGENHNVYAWVTRDEFTLLCDPESAGFLENCMSHYSVQDGATASSTVGLASLAMSTVNLGGEA